jgi:hypothetical protein
LLVAHIILMSAVCVREQLIALMSDLGESEHHHRRCQCDRQVKADFEA